MENASKALIIAGAILISILLISVGIIIMNAINDPVQQGAGAAESQAVEMFNSKFTGYAGVQTGNTVKSLITAIESTKADEHYFGDTLAMTIGSVKTKASYLVDFTYGDDGYIDGCTITEQP